MLKIIGLFVAVVWCSSTVAFAGDATEVKVIGPFVSGNLAVYLVRGPNLLGDKSYLTLSEGLEQGKVTVFERDSVNQLAIENRSDRDLFVQAGEIVKGGKQDRTLGKDMVLSAHSDEIPIPVNCVESGRWTQRGDEDQTQFRASTNSLSSKALKQANYDGDQESVWANVASAQGRLAANVPAAGATASPSPTSLELTVEGPAVAGAAEDYEVKLKKSTDAAGDVIGFIYAINGKLNSGDVYASSDLFKKMYPKLLHAAAVEALADREANWDKISYDVPKPDAVEAMINAVDDAKGQPLSMDAVQVEHDINRQAGMPEAVASDKTGNRAEVLKKETDQIVMYETWDSQSKAPFLHRAYLTK
jgi:hypothetical protein